MSQLLTISVVIPSYNEGEDLIQTLHTIFSQSVLFDEVIVVDDSSDGTDILVKETFADKVKLIHREKKLGRCSARNVGITLSSCEVVVILNADVSLPNNFCKQLKDKYLSSNCDALGVDLVITNTEHDYARYLYALHLSANKEEILWTEGFSVRRSAFLKTQGFPDGYPLSILAGEDGEFCFALQRNGANICLDFDIKVSTIMPEEPKIIEDQIRGRASLRTWHFIYDKSILELILRSFAKQIYRAISIIVIVPFVYRLVFIWKYYNHGLIDLWNYARHEVYINWLRTCQEYQDVSTFYKLYKRQGIKLTDIISLPPSQLIHKFD